MRIAFRDPHGDDVGTGLSSPITVMQWVRVAQRAEPGHVIGVQMRVDGLDQLQVELAHQPGDSA